MKIIPPWLARKVTALVFRSLHHLDSFLSLNKSHEEQKPEALGSEAALLALTSP